MYRYNSERLLRLWLNKGSPRHGINGARGHFIFRVFHHQPLRAILIYLYEPETRILSAVGTKNERCHLFCHSCGVLLSSNVPDFKRQFVTGVYWRYLVKFDFANKEDQPRAGTRLRRVLVKVKKIENR